MVCCGTLLGGTTVGSMSESDSKFDKSVDAWAHWQSSPWGRLRYSVARANLDTYVGGRSGLRVLDLGGGDGLESILLARNGNQVTLVDSSPAMLDIASGRADAAGVSASMTFVNSEVLDLPRSIATGSFDVVLLHNVLQYLPQGIGALPAVTAPLADGGIFSVISINKFSEPIAAAARRADPTEALNLLGESRYRSVTFDSDLTMFAAGDIIDAIEATGDFGDVNHYGIRCFSDFIAADDEKWDPEFYSALEALELASTARWPYMHTARLFQIIGRRASKDARQSRGSGR